MDTFTGLEACSQVFVLFLRVTRSHISTWLWCSAEFVQCLISIYTTRMCVGSRRTHPGAQTINPRPINRRRSSSTGLCIVDFPLCFLSALFSKARVTIKLRSLPLLPCAFAIVSKPQQIEFSEKFSSLWPVKFPNFQRSEFSVLRTFNLRAFHTFFVRNSTKVSAKINS